MCLEYILITLWIMESYLGEGTAEFMGNQVYSKTPRLVGDMQVIVGSIGCLRVVY